MRARLVLEPELAREAAFHATADDIETLRLCLAGSREAQTWRQYETWDNRLHRSVAQASHNALLLAVFDTMNAVRRAVVWGRMRQDRPKPPADHHSFAEHEAARAGDRGSRARRSGQLHAAAPDQRPGAADRTVPVRVADYSAGWTSPGNRAARAGLRSGRAMSV